jgi:tetratricopeptide (TPR) repeat protein
VSSVATAARYPGREAGPVTADTADRLAAGNAALARADEAFATFDVDGLLAHLSTAVRELTAAGDNRRAAVASARLGDMIATTLGNLPAGRAWLARARRLVADEPPCIEQGWVAVAGMGCEVDDPAELLAAAELALDRARRFGDVELETKALADGGLAHVQCGRIDQGMAMLDEAMALACGQVPNSLAVSASVCSFFTACYHAADFGRADTWAELLRRHRLIGPTAGAAVFLSSHCDAVHATLLVELGRWGEAEELLQRSIEEFRAVMPMPAWHPTIALADLRVRQGRLVDAEQLLLGWDQFMQALLPTARLHLARGDHDLARAVARRGVQVAGSDRLRAAELLAVLVDAELGRDDLAAASAACAELAARIGDVDVPPLRARSDCARSRALVAAGDAPAAVAVLTDVLGELDPAQLPLVRSSVLLALARAHDAAGDDGAARQAARAADELLGRIDVVVAPDDAELVARLGEPRDVPASATLAHDGRWWTASSDATSVRLPDSKGLRYLAELLRAPDVERHALDLVDRVEGVDPAVDRRRLGDAGPAADGAARAAYRRRIEALREEIADAEADGRHDAAEARHAELEVLVGQLAQAFGLGGRDRPQASAAERARLNVTRALRSAITRLVEVLPAAAALDRGVRTGRYCVYRPLDGDVRWIVQSPLNGPSAD